MTRDNTFGLKAILGIVLMLNLAMVPFYNAAIAKGNSEHTPYTPGTTPEWRFGSAEDGAGVAEVAAGVMGIVGMVGAEAEVAVQPEAEDPAIQELLDFHVLAFETVFGRDYDGEESGYLFEQPLDESTYATIVPGWNTVGEPVDALVLLAQPIDVSDFADPGNGVTIISAAHIAGTLEGVDKQGFWGISMVYDFSDGVRYNDLFLLQDLNETTEKALLANAGLMDYGRGDPDEMQACIKAAVILFQACMAAAFAGLGSCNDTASAVTTGCLIVCVGITASTGWSGIGTIAGLACVGLCYAAELKMLSACAKTYDGDTALCYGKLQADLLDCGIRLAMRPTVKNQEYFAVNQSFDAILECQLPQADRDG